jgi:hypothetical protein
MGGNAFVSLMMFSWIPAVLYIFSRYPARKAMIMSFIFAWLFLPVVVFKLPGIPDYTKMSAACYGILLATFLFNTKRISSFKVSWVDIPMMLWCISPFISSVVNDLGAYDGFSTMQNQIVVWAVPYFLGRIYLDSLAGLRQLAVGLFIGGLVYIPFCWYESRTFSSLHILVYGLNTGRDAAQSIRYGGYRPQVFFEHGLMLGVWLMTACLMGIMLWRMGIVKRLWNLPISLLVSALLITFIIARSTGAYALFLIGLVILLVAWQFRTAILLWALILGICWYLYMGVTGTFPNKQVIDTLSQTFDAERVASVKFRFDNEEILGARARERMLFGWGGFGRNRVFDEYGKDISITDSLWIIAFGINGAFGVATLTASILLPVISFCIRYPAKLWSRPVVAPAATLAVCITLYMFDSVLNAMVNPIFMLAAGGLATVSVQSKQATTAQLNGQIVPIG